MFEEVATGTEGGFFEGKVITEYDLNLSMRFYYMEPGIFDIMDGAQHVPDTWDRVYAGWYFFGGAGA